MLHFADWYGLFTAARSGAILKLLLSESGVFMILEAILDEVDQLHNVSPRLEELAEQHPPVSEALIPIAGSVRGTATRKPAASTMPGRQDQIAAGSV
jgi:hypothetical protein